MIDFETPFEAFARQLNRPDIVCDIDGVLAFFMEVAITAVNAHFGAAWRVVDVKSYWVEDWLPKEQGEWLVQQFADPNFYLNIPPDYAAIAALQQLEEDGYHIIIASDRPPEAKGITEDWLKLYRIPAAEVVLEGRGTKRGIAAKHGPDNPMVLIDDDPRKAIQIPGPGVQLFIPRRFWTPAGIDSEPGVMIFDTWDEVLDILEVDTDDITVPQLDVKPTDKSLSAQVHELWEATKAEILQTKGGYWQPT